MGRKACKRETEQTLRSLRPLDAPGDGVTRMWIVRRCEACGRCPKLIAKLDITRPVHELPPPTLLEWRL